MIVLNFLCDSESMRLRYQHAKNKGHRKYVDGCIRVAQGYGPRLVIKAGHLKGTHMEKHKRIIGTKRPNESWMYTKQSEFSMHMKYDDLTKEERRVLVHMDQGGKYRWGFNDFRKLPVLNNDGDLISSTLASLREKHYIQREGRGWILVR